MMQHERRSRTLALSTALIVVLFCSANTSCSKSPMEKEAAFLKKGKALRATGKYAQAILEFRNAAQAAPKDAEPYYQLGLAYLDRNDVSNASANFSRAVALNPKHSQAQLQMASFAIIGNGILKDPQLMEDAQHRIAEVLASKPGDTDALELRAITEYKLGHIEAAQQDLRRALEKSPRHLRSSVSLANLKMQAHDIAGAESILKLAMKNDPNSSEAALAAAQFYLATGRNSEAEALTRHASELDPKNVTALNSLAWLQMNSGSKAEAEQTYRKLSTLPDSASKPAYAIFLFQQGRRDEAVSELKRLLKENPSDRNIRGLLVTSYVTMGRPKEAERILTEVLKNNPHDVEALFQQSAFYLDQRQFPQAESALQAVLRANPESAAAHYSLARVNAARGAVAKQADELREALRIDPAFLAARIELAEITAAKNPKAALQILDEAKEEQRKSPRYLIVRNWTLLALNKYAEVRQGLDNALAAGKTAEVLYQDAYLRFEEKDYLGSRKSLEEALKLNPDYMAALDLLARSYAVQNKPAKALEVVKQYAANKPSSPYLGGLIGSWQVYGHHLPEAKAAFQAVISANPKFIPARLSLAQVEVDSGDTDAARHACERSSGYGARKRGGRYAARANRNRRGEPGGGAGLLSDRRSE